MLRSIPDNGQDKIRTIIRDFLDKLSERGNDVSECPYIVARHDNTDNEHYHIVIRTTDINSKRFSDKFINKNANRAAACIAMKYGLEAPSESCRTREGSSGSRGVSLKEESQSSPSQSEIDEKMHRKRAVEETAKRRAMLKYVIEKLAKEPGSVDTFISGLAAEGISLTRDEKKGLCAVMTDSDGNVRKYYLAKDLGVDMTLIPNLSIPDKSDTKTSQSSPLKPTHNLRLNVDGGGPRNAEHEINDGFNSDDPNEEWKRSNGYKM